MARRAGGSGLVGDVWYALSPFETAAALARVADVEEGRQPAAPLAGVRVWPAAALLLAFGWLKLAIPTRRSHGGWRRRRSFAWPSSPRAPCGSLVAITLAYAVAHYFSLLVFEGQRLLALASDPVNSGWNLFGTADWTVDYAAVSPTTIAWVQVGAIVVGHLAGVVLAHDRAVALFHGKTATRSQMPLLAAMVAYTIGGLTLLLGGG